VIGLSSSSDGEVADKSVTIAIVARTAGRSQDRPGGSRIAMMKNVRDLLQDQDQADCSHLGCQRHSKTQSECNKGHNKAGRELTRHDRGGEVCDSSGVLWSSTLTGSWPLASSPPLRVLARSPRAQSGSIHSSITPKRATRFSACPETGSLTLLRRHAPSRRALGRTPPRPIGLSAERCRFSRALLVKHRGCPIEKSANEPTFLLTDHRLRFHIGPRS
jgi:hypothetical protein